jgi:phage-related protein
MVATSIQKTERNMYVINTAAEQDLSVSFSGFAYSLWPLFARTWHKGTKMIHDSSNVINNLDASLVGVTTSVQDTSKAEIIISRERERENYFASPNDASS